MIISSSLGTITLVAWTEIKEITRQKQSNAVRLIVSFMFPPTNKLATNLLVTNLLVTKLPRVNRLKTDQSTTGLPNLGYGLLAMPKQR
jgi:hypothetical protein